MNYKQPNNGYNNNVNYNNGYNYTQPAPAVNNYVVTNDVPLSYYIKRFLIGLILAALLIFLLLWLFPTRAGLKDTINEGISDAFDKTFAEKLNPLYDRIFDDNLNTMKEVATAYFTTDRLPKVEGETKKLTLGDMLEMKLLRSIKDKDGKMCDKDKSYVEVTKLSNEYKMKVNLSCGGEEDYIVVYLGCYNYCLNDVCEKKEVVQAKTEVIQGGTGGSYTYTRSGQTKVVEKNNIIERTKIIERIKTIIIKEKEKPICTYDAINKKYYGRTGEVVSKEVFKQQCIDTPAPETHICGIYNGRYYGKDGYIVSKERFMKECMPEEPHYCEKVNGKYYGKNGNIVSKEQFKKECESEPDKHYCEIVNGKYYGKDGYVVSKETYKKQCEPEEPHYCVIYNGKYYGKYGTVVSKETFKKQCESEPETHYCEIVDGKYYGKNGTVVSKEQYKKECESEQDLYKYQYKKTVTINHEAEYSKWSDWSANIEYNPDNNNINWGTHELEINEKVGYKTTKYYEYIEDRNQPVYNTFYDRIIGYRTQYACNGYTYIIDGTTNTTYYTSVSGGSGWKSTGRTTLSYKPADTSTKRYVLVGFDYDKCNDTCTLKPYYIFDVQTRSLGTATTTMTSTSKATVSAVCSDVVTKEIPIYGKRTEFAGYVTDRVLKERKTYYYHRKTRTITKEAWIEKKNYIAWAYNDHEATLLNQGYHYTGYYEKINN